jgi:hypothetical protein
MDGKIEMGCGTCWRESPHAICIPPLDWLWRKLFPKSWARIVLDE